MSWKRSNLYRRMNIFLTDLPLIIKGYMVDIGTGNGVFAELLEEKYPENLVLQLDIRNFNQIYQLSTYGAIQSIPLRDQSLSLVIAAQVLHYIPHHQQQQVINSLLSGLVDDGILVVVEYRSNRSYSWLPYPIPINQIEDFETIVPLSHIVRDSDQHRPKYAAYFTRREAL